jgi:hypothetical protein
VEDLLICSAAVFIHQTQQPGAFVIMDIPNHLKQRPGHGQHGTTRRAVRSWGKKARKLPFKRPPIMKSLFFTQIAHCDMQQDPANAASGRGQDEHPCSTLAPLCHFLSLGVVEANTMTPGVSWDELKPHHKKLQAGFAVTLCERLYCFSSDPICL